MENKKKIGKKVVVGMSGGVDSSVSAFLLKKQGFDVVGLFMQNWDTVLNSDIKGHVKNDENQCNAQKDFADAKAAADSIGISIYRTEFIDDYWTNVFKYMIEEYKKGRTPNPDVLCNKFIKFDKFISYAKKKFDCDYVAMGHYAKVEKRGNKHYLKKSATEDKDQTYFLCWLSQEQLSQIIFPLGNITKKEVREIAKKECIPTWAKKDSTGICFIGERKFKEFLSNYIPSKKGDVYDIVTKKKVGQHDGVMYYTNGQNKGLGLSGQTDKYYVCDKNVEKNILYVVDQKHKNNFLESNNCVVEQFNWISGVPKSKNVEIRFRHRQKLVKGEFQVVDGKVQLNYTKTLSVTPGQFAVIYQNDTCLGGGIVSSIASV